MDTKLTVAPRHDPRDAERFRDMLASPPFQLLRGRMYAELERARANCETKSDPVDVYRVQGTVSALRVVLALPDQILKEMEGQRKP
jgi:hypothetical protein